MSAGLQAGSLATLVLVCYACCGDPSLTYWCPRCAGTGTEPYPGGTR